MVPCHAHDTETGYTCAIEPLAETQSPCKRGGVHTRGGIFCTVAVQNPSAEGFRHRFKAVLLSGGLEIANLDVPTGRRCAVFDERPFHEAELAIEPRSHLSVAALRFDEHVERFGD